MTPYLIAGGVVAGVVAIGIAYAAGRDHGLASGRAECEARIAEGERQAAAERMAIADRASEREFALIETRRTVEGLTDALRRAEGNVCPVSEPDRERVRAIIDAATAAPGPSAR